jgi:hypothetical protein
LWLQIKSKLLAGETGSEPLRCIYFAAFFRASFLTNETLLPHPVADPAVTGLRFSQADWKM